MDLAGTKIHGLVTPAGSWFGRLRQKENSAAAVFSFLIFHELPHELLLFHGGSRPTSTYF